MTTAKSTDERIFDLAFQLAYFIHVNKDIAFFVAEDAIDELPLLLGIQEKNRKKPGRLSGFWKSGERVRPIKQIIRFRRSQMLQWLVYKQSASWERQTECGEGLYLPTDEDMIVRYLEHLVFLTLRQGSFYVTLAIGALLYQFDRRETRLLYDILTQSDSARMKDMGYIGKQRLELIGRICSRFNQMIQTTRTPGGERQLAAQPTTRSVIDLVHQCAQRFIPWETDCVVNYGFEVTDIPGLYFSGDSSSDEDTIELDRIHTVLDPDCFSRFVEGLCQYVRTLPSDTLDQSCNYGSLDERLAVPRFSNFPAGSPRGDRLQPPSLTKEDYVRLQRTLAARARRRKGFAPEKLFIYVDDLLVQSVELTQTRRVELLIGPEAGVIEVRGRDDAGELLLAALLVEFGLNPTGGAFIDSVVHQGGQKVEIRLTPIWEASREVTGARVVVQYRKPRLTRLLSVLLRDRENSQGSKPGYAWLKASLASALMIATLALVWFQVWAPRRKVMPPEQAEQPSTMDDKPSSAVTPPPPRQKPQSKAAAHLARATWSRNPQSALRAIPIEPARGEVKTIELSRGETQVLVSVPKYNENGLTYSRYRVSLFASGKEIWRQTLRIPSVSLVGNAHVLNVALSSVRLPQSGPFDLKVEGLTQNAWQSVGHVLLNPVKR